MRYSTHVSRRSFLALAGALPLATRAAFAASKIPVGLELYSVRDFLAKDLTGHGSRRRETGLRGRGVLLAVPQWTPQVGDEVRKLLDDLGIKCPSTHNGTGVHPRGLAESDRPQSGHRQQGDHHGQRRAGQDDRRLEGGGRSAQRRRRQAPVRWGWWPGIHNHQLEWKPVEGQRPMDIIASRTPKDVVLQFDVGTCVEAGADPIAWIKANPGRIKSMHCKDWAAGGKGYAVLFGEGDAPVAADLRGGRVRRRRRVLPDRAGSRARRRAAQARRVVPGELEEAPGLTLSGIQPTPITKSRSGSRSEGLISVSAGCLTTRSPSRNSTSRR